ncbi:5-(carboxyamino)imidazole ribonucleotide synthase, partial [filamentous cyanobacterium LEGE 11480]|nr:5-(carboxyamino)imidazole ribonucleotide synthase [Romeriopsis navalis LEGE 11480]
MPTRQRIGIIGGGQLAWMMAEASKKLNLDLIIQTPKQSDPAAAIASSLVLAPVGDATATATLAQRSDVITFENEFVDLTALGQLEAQGICFRPRLSVLKPLLDKYKQRQFFRQHQLPTPNFIS